MRALFLPEAASQPGGAKLVNRFGGAALYVEYVVRLAGVSCTFVAPSAFQLLCGTGSLVFVYAKLQCKLQVQGIFALDPSQSGGGKSVN